MKKPVQTGQMGRLTLGTSNRVRVLSITRRRSKRVPPAVLYCNLDTDATGWADLPVFQKNFTPDT